MHSDVPAKLFPLGSREGVGAVLHCTLSSRLCSLCLGQEADKCGARMLPALSSALRCRPGLERFLQLEDPSVGSLKGSDKAWLPLQSGFCRDVPRRIPPGEVQPIFR